MKQVKDKHFVPFLDSEQIQNRIKEIASQINQDYEDKNPLLVGVLNGSFMFIADLFKNIEIDCEVTFIRFSSYTNTESSGTVKKILGLNENIEGRDIIVVEDIVDTGLTMQEILRYLQEQKPNSIKILTLLFKPDALKVPMNLDYVGFEIANRFVVGYGLDYDNLGRNLPSIYVVA